MKPQHPFVDRISTLPPSIIEKILCRLFIDEAARTSVLSKEWRYKWTKIPKLVFSELMFMRSTDDENQESVSEQTMASEREKMGTRCKLFDAIYQVLLMRQGPIHEFALYMTVDKTCVEIDHIISYLSRNNAVKTLKLDLFQEKNAYYGLPLSIFSLHHLTDLQLSYCDLNFQSTFSGFNRLTSLFLKDTYISTKTLLHLVSTCPLLKRFFLFIDEQHFIGDDKSTITELFNCLPVIESLCTFGAIAECFIVDLVPQQLPTLLIHLKSFYMGIMCFNSPDHLHFLALLIRSSPNLEKLTLYIDEWSNEDRMVSVVREAYPDTWLEHLKELNIDGFCNFKPEFEFVKFIVDKSPKLKKVGLRFENKIDANEELEMLRVLQSSPASPLVEFILT